MKATQYLSFFKYLAIKGESRFSVCRDAYKSIYAVSNKAVISLQIVLVPMKSSFDIRGKHINRGHVVSTTVLVTVN